jgi:hypothetical protein
MSKKTVVNSTWVTTLDNPFNPLEDMENWKRFDEDYGYNTTSLICRYLHDADDISDESYYEALEEAVDIICRFNFTGNYRKVQKPIEID